jgi:AraC-like DNA-binding protein/quercetin dioxygenase-like cupin family protein
MVSVSAILAKNLPRPANWGRVAMRVEPSVRAGTFEFEGSSTTPSWHNHDLHQVEYAVSGTVEVETSGGRYLLPPQQAAWIPAGLEHRTRIPHSVRTVSVFFAPDLVTTHRDAMRIIAVTPVVREMVRHGIRWPITRSSTDYQADAYFTALAGLVTDCLEYEAPLRLPVTSDPLIAAVIEYTDHHLSDVTVDHVCRKVGISDRTLRRRFPKATGISWRTYLQQARLLYAMAMLAEPEPTVLQVATAVGFESLSAFSRGFVRITGETPSAYRRRALDAAP